MRLLQKLRKRAGGTDAHSLAMPEARDALGPDPHEHAAKQESHLMGGFSKAQAVVKTEEDPHM